MAKSKRQTQQGERKVKIVYYDDNSTVADMSGTRKNKSLPKRKSTMKEKARTYFAVVKKMFVPMLCTLAAFTLVFLLLYFLFLNA